MAPREEVKRPSTTGQPTLMVVTGAGASHDSVPARIAPTPGLRPPTTDTLFDNAFFLHEYMPRGPARSLAATVERRLREAPRPDFETVITEEYRRSQANTNLRAGFTALRFYLRDLFRILVGRWTSEVGGVTNYQWLVREVEAWRAGAGGRVLWITFNYDTMLDEALEDVFQHSFGSGGDPDPELAPYVSSPEWSLLKLHGSCDWRRRTNLKLRDEEASNYSPLSRGRLVEKWDSEADPPTEATTYARGNWESDADDARTLWVPALMAPLAGKSTFECPPSHIKRLATVLPTGDLILTIGWRAQERHFLQMLRAVRQNPPDVYSVTRGQASAGKAAELVRSACGRVDRPASDKAGVVALGLQHEGFSALADERANLAGELGDWIGRARERREARAAEIGRFD